MSHGHGPANRRRIVLDDAAPLFVRFPDGPPRTAVVVLHDVFGLTEPVEHRCRVLAAAGHLVVAPYLYHQSGGREFAGGAAVAAMARLAPAMLVADVAAALDHLTRRQDVAREATAVVGIGSGRHLAALAAAAHPVAAAVGLGAGRSPWGAPAPRPPVPWLDLPEDTAAATASLRFLHTHLPHTAA